MRRPRARTSSRGWDFAPRNCSADSIGGSRENRTGGSSIHIPEARSRRGIPSSLDIHSPEDRGNRADPNNLGIHSPENRSKRGIPSSQDIHSPVARSPDIRKQ
jgi:hypothetical protein